MPEPTLADVIGRFDRIDRQFEVIALELRALRAEMTAGIAELRLDISILDKATRDLWTEHLGHSHPDPQS